MQRELKFRIWDKRLNCYENWAETEKNLLEEILIHPKGLLVAGSLFLDENNFVVQQFTGLFDANNKEIYEGDIIKTDDETLLVEFCEEYAKFGAIIYLQDGREPENTVWYWGDDLFHTHGEVVGNICENADLLS